MTELRPPAKWAHLPWHWLTVDNNKAVKPWLGDNPTVAEWEDGFWRIEGHLYAPQPAFVLRGLRYHGPCDPAAIVPDPDNKAMVAYVRRGIAEAAGCTHGGMCIEDVCGCTDEARAALRALAEMKETGDV